MSGRGKLLGNSLSLLTNRLGQSLSALVIVTLVARMLGAHALGQYMLAFSFYFVVMTIVAQGFKTLFTREMAKDATRAGDYLVSGSVLQLGCALIGYLALVALVSALPYSAETSAICVLFGVMLIPYALSNVTESVFQAFDKMHFIAISTAPVYLLRVIAVWLALRSGAGLQREGQSAVQLPLHGERRADHQYGRTERAAPHLDGLSAVAAPSGLLCPGSACACRTTPDRLCPWAK